MVNFCVLLSCERHRAGLHRTMKATYACQACGLCHTCGPARNVAPTALNPQCYRRSLRLPFLQHHATKGRRLGLQHVRPSVSQQGRAKPGSLVTKYRTTASTEVVRRASHTHTPAELWYLAQTTIADCCKCLSRTHQSQHRLHHSLQRLKSLLVLELRELWTF